ncbi:hypothetical protein F5Y14DRAFT_421931 [Nemania sp. NC0429]|nr:hypothetical protein F5Y14DRAFT_421931 [Nemania sp. NC0429]
MQAPSGTLIGEFWRNVGGQADVGVESTLLALGYITLGLRLWSRRIQRARLQLNDWLIMCATVTMTARYSLELVSILKCGIGLHTKDVVAIGGADLPILFLKLLYAIDLLWIFTLTFIKISILHFYSVVFRKPVFLWFVYATIGLCVGFWFGAFFGRALICLPVQKKWYPETPGHCGDEIKYYLAISSLDFAIDIIIIILPMPILWTLNLPNIRKVGLTLVFSVGLTIVIITAVRFKYFFQFDQSDFTFTILEEAILSAVLPLLGIVNANILVMQPALRKIFGSMSALTRRSQSSSTDASSKPRHFERLHEAPNAAYELDGPVKGRSINDRRHIRVTTDWEVHSTLVSEPRNADSEHMGV